ncbi:MAG TPA: hypothetical protein VE545_09460 [Candidatus Dormibacteraeota bacterium]|nr:hypothetical protein [Candidatus Dormibacteraeota bacterium]
MSRWQRVSSIAVPVSVFLGLIFSVLPRTWIESTFEVDPDSGSGVRELMLASVPVPIAIAFAAYLFRKPASASTPSPCRGAACRARLL